jgi:hypothetical protein
MTRKQHPADKSLPRGLYADTRPAPPQIVDIVIESGAMRSRSEGLIPTVMFTLTDDTGGKYEGMMRCDGPEMAQVANDILEAIVVARQDVTASRPGSGKSHGQG